ncbi:MAG TPA: gamma-glutamyltransferase, partial [Lacipirellulaceae bacterium]|nr:gamma-glutamyltransferase [Lacipirellulaceae bacterium]
MTNCWRLLCPLAGVLLAALCLGCTQAPPKSATANHEAAVSSHDGGSAACMVATVNPYATRAGVAAFERGGNALDAAIAAALTLGVVDSSNSGIGGGCFILIRTPGGEVAAIDGREIAPAAATRDMYLRDGEADPALSQTGALAVAVPGALAAYELAIQRHGQLTLADLLRPAADLAAAGFPIDRVLAARIEANQDDLARFAGARSVFLKRDRTPWPRKHLLKQPDLAKTYRAIADEGVDWFYRGPFADKVGEWMRGNGGILTAEDFAAYRAVEREPLRTSYRQWTIVGFPPPSSGGVHVGQILNMLERFDMAEEYRRDPAQALHLVAEAMKRAFADRAHWLGDPDFVDVPRGLLDQAYADELARRIDPRRAVAVAGHGDPPGAAEDVFGKKHTTHNAAVDSDG